MLSSMNVKHKPCRYCGKERERHFTPKGNSKINSTCGNASCLSQLRKDINQILSIKAKIIAKEKGYGKWMKGKTLSENTKKKIGLKSLGHTLSDDARNKISIALAGSNNGSWKGGISTENNKLRNSIAYKNWRQNVFKRDKFKCGFCEKGSNLNAHHILSFNDNKSIQLAVWNGITLCHVCHKRLHKEVGNNTNLDNMLQFYKEFVFNKLSLKGASI